MANRLVRQLRHRWLLSAALPATIVLGLSGAPALAQEIDPQTTAIEQALADKQPVEAETLARAALESADALLAAETLRVANLNRLLGDSLFNQEKYAEAEPFFRRALALREAQLDANHLDIAVSANDLGIVLRRQQRYAEALPLYRQVLAIRETALGPHDANTANAAFWVSRVLDSDGHWAAAAEAMGEAVEKAAIAFGATDPTTADWMGQRAAMLHDAGDADAAETAYAEAIRVGETAFGPDDARLAFARQGLGNLYYTNGRAAEAVPLFRAALAGREASLGPDDPVTISSADRLARALWQIEEITEAETLFRRVLVVREKTDGPDSAAVADVLRWIGRAASAQDRRAEAEVVFKRALEITERQSGLEHVLTAFDLIALGQLYSGQQRFDEARPLLQRAVAILETSDETRRSAAAGRMALSFLELATGDVPLAIELAERSLADVVATAGAGSREAADIMVSIGGYRFSAGEFDEAERMIGAGLDIYRAVAPDARALLRGLSEMGRIRQAQGRYDEALAVQRDVLARLSARYGSDSTELQPALSDIARTLFATGDHAGALGYFEQSTAMVERLAAIDAEAAFQSRTGDVEDQAIARAAIFDHLVKTYSRLADARPAEAGDYAGRAFLVAQRVIESEAARALAQMSARQASGSGDLAALVRERQDLAANWQRQDSALTLALATAPDARDDVAIDTLRASLAEADTRIVAIDGRLAMDFPAFAQLQKPTLATIGDVQSRLEENEVLLFFADTNKLGAADFETYLWAIPKSGEPDWIRLPRSTGELAAAVRELRNGMGVGANTRGPTAPSRTGGDATDRVLLAASELHDALLAEVTDLIAGKDLVIVPSKSLSALPFHALVSVKPDADAADRYREAHWLARDHAITILPSVASLAPAGHAADTSQDGSPYLAFANPLLTGRSGEDRRAFDRVDCAPRGGETVVVASAEMPPLATLFRGASADVASVRALPPLPETTDEVCAIAAVLGAPADAVYVGAAATEAAVRQLSEEGALKAASVLHFATHGLVSGELAGLAEPAIVLTPPDLAGPDDDGLLTASEVTTLQLDADWVILSACNTASSDGGGEALSGLARAFFYAGARALMVSHWPVNSDAAVELATGAVGALTRDPSIGRAEALRRAMVAEIDRGGIHADPANWAPFILVGASR